MQIVGIAVAVALTALVAWIFARWFMRFQARAASEALRVSEQQQEQMRAQFKALAADVLGEQSQQFRSASHTDVEAMLKPFKENISEFRARIEQIHTRSSEQQGALGNELRNLMELNRRITAEASSLTRALKGESKTQGDWGEMLLSSILDNSSLVRGVHYDTQVTARDGEGDTLRPDVVLYLPEGKRIIIDSKVSLKAFVESCAAEDEASRAALTAAHVRSMRQHVRELGRKEYQRLVESPDFVIMFVPNEPAFLAAMQADPAIWSDAYEQKVIVSSPTNLFALLKLVDDLWRRNDQTRNTAAILQQATTLYEQLVAFSVALEGVGMGLDTARKQYDEAFKRFHTGNNNIVRTGQRLLDLGLQSKKQFSERLQREAENNTELME